MGDLRLMKGNEVVAEAAIRAGADGYFGYPITPQSEVLETLMERKPWEETGMTVLQAESEVASINMLYGGASCGKKVMTSSSGPGISLMQEGLSYIAGAELPCLLVNVVRGGPGLGTIQPSQADYTQAVKTGGHGDYKVIVLAPSSVQEMNDFVDLSFELAFKYRNPAMILSDGAIGQMMEKVELSDYKPRLTEDELRQKYGHWATLGKTPNRDQNVVTSVELDSGKMEEHNMKLRNKYAEIQKNEVRYQTVKTEDADYLLVAYGLSARICQKTVDIARENGYKVGLLRPITLFPFPVEKIRELSEQVKSILTVEMNTGQMMEDVRLASQENVPVEFYGRMGGIVPSPQEIFDALVKKIGG